MSYFKINNNDYSMYVNELKITDSVSYRAQTNAAGNTVVDNANRKRTIEVGIIPLDAEIMTNLLTDVDSFEVNLSFLNPKTNVLEEEVLCVIPQSSVEYYTIRADKTSFRAFKLTFTEL